jgi:hypothetical protein
MLQHRVRLSVPVWAASLLIGLIVGCYGADNPKITEAPTYSAPKVQEPPAIPGRSRTYGQSPEYQKKMERMQQTNR